MLQRDVGKQGGTKATRAATLAISSALIERGRTRRRLRPLPQIRGGSDAALVVREITDARLCLHCLARKTGVSVLQANALLTTIVRTFRLKIGPHRCDACLERKTTFSITKDGQP